MDLKVWEYELEEKKYMGKNPIKKVCVYAGWW